MRPTTSPTNKINAWNSPIPYLFGSLAILLTLIGVALILLLCSFKKQSSSSNSASDGDNASEKPATLLRVLDPEPKIVVIMAGDEEPSFLAMPAVPSTICRCDDQV